MTNAHARAWLALAMILLAAPRLHAQTSTAGTPVAVTHLAAESYPTVISDGTGGAFIGFKVGWRSADLPTEIAIARVLASAGRHPEWTASPPQPPGSMLMSQFASTRILLAPQGRVLAFGDATSTSQPQAHFVRRMQADGVDPSFGTYAPDYSYSLFSVLPRSDGGATVFSRVPGSRNCLATVVSPTGTAIQIYTQMNFNVYDSFTFGGERVTAVPSGGDGAIMVEAAGALGGSTSQVDLIAVKLDGNGNAVWVPVYRVISSAAKDQLEQVMTTDAADGAIVAWTDGRSITTVAPDIYAVRLLADGTYAPGWPATGKIISNAARPQYTPAIERDDVGGAWFAWTDERDTLSGPSIYFTHLLADGSIATGFAANGRALCAATGSQTGVQLTRDGSGGIFAVWLDARDALLEQVQRMTTTLALARLPFCAALAKYSPGGSPSKRAAAARVGPSSTCFECMRPLTS